jgi:REP element-mobilizing transposase RayT
MAIPTRHANPLNVIASERTFFVTSATWGRRRVLQSTRSAELFVRTLYEYRGQGKYRLHEFVVMPDHFHLLITVGSGITIERAVQFIKGGFAFRAGREFGIRRQSGKRDFPKYVLPTRLLLADSGNTSAIILWLLAWPARRKSIPNRRPFRDMCWMRRPSG